MNIEEIYVKIDQFDSYQISNYGNVKSLAKQIGNGRGRLTEEIILKPDISFGYSRVALFKDGNSKKFMIHRLVAKAFIKNIENKKFINHKDGNKSNNNVDNLEWVTSMENTHHALKIGLMKTGINHHLYNRKGFNSPRSKITREIYGIIHRMILDNFSVACISRKLNIAYSTIWRIKHNKDTFQFT